MVVLVATTLGLCVWLIAWALGAKPFDGLLLSLLIILPAAAWYVFGPGIRKLMGAGEPPS